MAALIDLRVFAVPLFSRNKSNLPAVTIISSCMCLAVLQVKEDDEAELARQQSTRVV